jgi:hypothetical protein
LYIDKPLGVDLTHSDAWRGSRILKRTEPLGFEAPAAATSENITNLLAGADI